MKPLLIAFTIVMATMIPQAHSQEIPGTQQGDNVIKASVPDYPVFITAGAPLAAGEEQQLLQSKSQIVSDMAGGSDGETAVLAGLGLIFCLVLIAGAAAA